MKKQSSSDRKRRLDQGCCPIHGIWMPQIGLNYLTYCKECGAPQKSEAVVGCPRKDCEIIALTPTIDGPWRLPKELEYLLAKKH